MGYPYEIIAAPYEIYTAPINTAFPAVNVVPASPWSILGTSGADNYTEDGVSVSHEQTVEIVRSLKSTGPRKLFRTEENLIITATLMDVSLEQYTRALNNVTVTVTAAGAGTPGTKDIPIYRGTSVAQFALLIRGPSPYDDDNFVMQYQIPVVFSAGSPNPVYVKGTPAGLAVEFQAVEDVNAPSVSERFGKIVAQNAAPL